MNTLSTPMRCLVMVLLTVLGTSGWAGAENYRLRANDSIEIKVFQETDLSLETIVSRDGTVLLPLIGSVKLGGLSATAAASRIRARYADGYLVNPQVNVIVSAYAKRRFSVIGEVKSAGDFEIPPNENITLIQALAKAGGATRLANLKKVVVKRRAGGRTLTRQFDVRAMAKKGAQQIYLVEGDVVTVPESVF